MDTAEKRYELRQWVPIIITKLKLQEWFNNGCQSLLRTSNEGLPVIRQPETMESADKKYSESIEGRAA